jgi:hypothetical protein
MQGQADFRGMTDVTAHKDEAQPQVVLFVFLWSGAYRADTRNHSIQIPGFKFSVDITYLLQYLLSLPSEFLVSLCIFFALSSTEFAVSRLCAFAGSLQ